MHPDQLLAALEAEKARSEPGRRTEIDAEIERVRRLPRPAVQPDTVTAADPRLEYLAALGREKARTDRSRHEAIDLEIARVKAEIRSAGTANTTARPDAETPGAGRRRGRPARAAAGPDLEPDAEPDTIADDDEEA